jgi:hypothetical protein
MISFLKKYKGFIYGLILFRVIVFVLTHYSLINIDNGEVLANSLSFIFCWTIISLPIHFYPFLKEHKRISLKVLGLIVIFLVVIVNDINSKIPDNPITFVGLIGVGLSFFSMIAPAFFRKHALIIIGFYVLALGHFFYVRLYIDDFSRYMQQEKEIKIILTTPFILLISSWVFQQWKWMKTVESKKDKAEIALLKSQINPHFFFNTLNNLYGLTVEKSDDAPDVVLKLSDMMRYTIYMGKEDYVPLKDEVEYLKNYIELHKIRYQKKLDIVFNDTCDSNYQISPLLFIIPLENAFKHGAERLTDNAYIHVDLKTEDGSVQFKIENNFEETDTDHKPGIGLENLEQRLNLLYPQKHSLVIENEKDVYKLSLKIETV